MASLPRTSEDSSKPDSPEAKSETVAAILEELERILASPFFRHSNRGKEFLSWVVRQKLEGHTENLKERSIGVAIFRRAANYATGDDPVVRVQAGEVRRRLDQYYQSCIDIPVVRVCLPLGSYAPEFQWDTFPSSKQVEDTPPTSDATVSGHRFNWWRAGFLGLLGIVVALSIYTALTRKLGDGKSVKQETVLARSAGGTLEVNKFWAPVLATSQPVMIYLAKGITYRPVPEVYEKYAQAHHGAFATEVQRSNEALPLSPDTKLLWRQMVVYTDYGVAAGDVDTAVRLATLFGKMGKADQVRVGANFSYADLSSSPTILIGAFNDRWTMKLMSRLHFALVDEGDSQLVIKEQIPHGREWHWQHVQTTHKDYAVVTRLVNSDTGQFTIVLAGCSGPGTEAAGGLVTSEHVLADAIRGLPKDWQDKNLQLVIETKVTDSIPEAARVVASYSW